MDKYICRKDKYTCSILYNPETKTNYYNAKYVCSDGKIHIRFKDFDKPQLIEGFEAKLAYLISFIFYEGNYSTKEEFLESNDIWLLNEYLKRGIEKYNNYKYKGLFLLDNYSKKDETVRFGVHDSDCFPDPVRQNNENEGSYSSKNKLNVFTEELKIGNIIDFLFNDSYKIIIHRKREIKENKFVRKQKKLQDKQSDLFELW